MLPRLEGHYCPAYLAPLLVLDPDNGRFCHLGKLEYGILHLGRVNVLSSGDEHVLLAFHNVEVAVLVHSGQVARVKPPACKCLFCGLRPVPVTLHHVRATHDQLSNLAHRHIVHVMVDHTSLQVKNGPADGAGLLEGEILAQSGYAGRSLAHAEALLEYYACLVILSDQVHR